MYELIDVMENYDNDLQFMQEKMRALIHHSKLVKMNEKAQII